MHLLMIRVSFSLAFLYTPLRYVFYSSYMFSTKIGGIVGRRKQLKTFLSRERLNFLQKRFLFPVCLPAYPLAFHPSFLPFLLCFELKRKQNFLPSENVSSSVTFYVLKLKYKHVERRERFSFCACVYALACVESVNRVYNDKTNGFRPSIIITKFL